MMDSATEAMSAELADELAASDRKLAVDTRSIPARFSHLKAIGQSAAHCREAFAEPDWKQSLSMRLGSGSHAMLFGTPLVLWDGKVRNGKVWDAFKSDNAGKTILNRKEWKRSEAIANAINRHDEASALLFAPGAVHEQTILWEQLGRSRRSTPDAVGAHYVVELKTTRCAEPGRFCRDAMFRGYHAQLADQIEAVRYQRGSSIPTKAYIVAVESVPPHVVTVLELTDRALDRGAALCRGWLERMLVCEADNHWPPYRESIEMFDVPDDDLDLVFGDDADEEGGE